MHGRQSVILAALLLLVAVCLCFAQPNARARTATHPNKTNPAYITKIPVVSLMAKPLIPETEPIKGVPIGISCVQSGVLPASGTPMIDCYVLSK